MKEVWKEIAGYEELYQVSNFGRIKSVKWGKDKILKPQIDQLGYLRIGLWKSGKVKRVSIHRLVASAFIPNTFNKPQVNHIDGNKLNNCTENLEWVTVAENNQHAYDAGLKKAQSGEKRYNAKLTDEQVKLIRENVACLTQRELAEKFGVCQQLISSIQKGKQRKGARGNVRNYNLEHPRRVPNEIRNQIRDEYKTGKISSSCLAKKYGVSQGTVLNIAKEK